MRGFSHISVGTRRRLRCHFTQLIAKSRKRKSEKLAARKSLSEAAVCLPTLSADPSRWPRHARQYGTARCHRRIGTYVMCHQRLRWASHILRSTRFIFITLLAPVCDTVGDRNLSTLHTLSNYTGVLTIVSRSPTFGFLIGEMGLTNNRVNMVTWSEKKL